LGAFDRWLATERNTAVARTRTAKQWNDFTDDSVKNQLYPNLKWIPSRSAHQREEHIPYYNRVWAKDDPFWRTNQPGSLWNCKCDWIETDEPANGLNAAVKPAKGLGGNPALTGELFSPDASYFTEKAQKAIFDVSYPDRLSRLQISVAADKYEIGDNIRTGRILLENFKEMQLAIRPHNRNQLNGPVKNPEYTLNGMIADAKRINSWNVARNFRSAIKQGAKVVIIDLFNMQRRELSANTLAKNIVQRHPDFTGGKIDSCYIVWKNKSIVLHNDLFHKYTDFKQHNYIIEIEEKIKELI
jgi:hypothetical protein